MRYLLQYWCENLKRSTHDWERDEIVGTLVLYVLAAVGIGAVKALGLIVDVGRLISLLLVVWFCILVFIVTPARRWRADQREKADLERRLVRKLDIVSGKAGPFIHRYPFPGLVEPKIMCITFRVLVKNLSEAMTVRNADERLFHADPPLEFMPIHLHLMNDNTRPYKTPFDLHTGPERS